MKSHIAKYLFTAAGFLFSTYEAFAQARFPKPEFSSGYKVPEMDVEKYVFDWEPVRIAVLVIMLALTAWALYKRRSRRILIGLSVANLLFFGFFLYGCTCPVGLVQNISRALIDSSAYVSAGALLLFLTPIIAALYFGRIFCMGGCPLGAIQELLHFKTIRLPYTIDRYIRFGAYFFLAFAVAAAIGGMGYFICRFDPFVVLFRAAGPYYMFIAAGVILAVNVFIARPFCRYVCPYGVILHFASLFSSRKVTPAPEKCVNCNLCLNVCPVDAIRPPAPLKENEDYVKGLRRTQMLLCMLPLMAIAGAFTGAAAGNIMSEHQPDTVILRDIKAGKNTVETAAFLSSGQSVERLESSITAQRRFSNGVFALSFAGAAMLAGIELIILARRRHEAEYTVDKADCICCGRCYTSCPGEIRRKSLKNKVNS